VPSLGSQAGHHAQFATGFAAPPGGAPAPAATSPSAPPRPRVPSPKSPPRSRGDGGCGIYAVVGDGDGGGGGGRRIVLDTQTKTAAEAALNDHVGTLGAEHSLASSASLESRGLSAFFHQMEVEKVRHALTRHRTSYQDAASSHLLPPAGSRESVICHHTSKRAI